MRRGTLRALKVLVVVMGLLIVAGFAVIATELVLRMASTRTESAQATTPYDTSLGLPAGSRIVDLVATNDRVTLHVRLPDGSDRLVLIDPRSGSVTARFALSVSPNAEP